MGTNNSNPVSPLVGQPGSGAPWSLAALQANGGTGFVPGNTVVCADSPAASSVAMWDGTAWRLVLTGVNVQLGAGGLLYESNSDTLTAHVGGGQAAALQLVSELNRIATVTNPADSVKLPQSAPGLTIIVVNHGANPMQVFGFGTDTIDDLATATGVSQMIESTVIYSCYTAGAWYTEGLASGYSKTTGLQTSQPANIAANATGTQASGTPLTGQLNTVSSAGAAYSVTLPVSVPGLSVTVITTTGVNTVAVFPNAGGTGTETINALAANAGLTMAALTSTTFNCTVAGQWYTTPRIPS